MKMNADLSLFRRVAASRPVWRALVVLAACLAVQPAFATALGVEDARHLLSRVGFGAPPTEVEAYARLTRQEAADRLLAGVGKTAVTPPPAWAGEPFKPRPRVRGMSPEERKLAIRGVNQQVFELQSWWVGEMLATPSPLTEKMTLFWHNHFVTSERKVRLPLLLHRQNALFRQHAVGNFAELLHAVARDPAMVIYLDSASNRKGSPNENFAREVMELFTLGEGNYGEQDIREAARAFTGWSLDTQTGEFVFRPAAHDDGEKTVLGRTGRFGGDQVLDILLEQPQAAEYIVSKLWREFVSPQPDRAEVKRIAAAFRDSRYDIRAALREMLISEAFYARENRGALIKSPVDLVVGTLRQFQFRTGDVLPFVFATSELGQVLFAPPNVKGWPGGEAWINSSTLLMRKVFLERLFRVEELRPMMTAAVGEGGAMGKEAPRGIGRIDEGRERYARAMGQIHFDGDRWLAQVKGGDPASVRRMVLAAAPVGSPPPDTKGMDVIRQLTQDPVYQLK
jgi:uncharacterized protein (DUF1800 family)